MVYVTYYGLRVKLVGWDEARIPAQHRENAGIRKLIPAYLYS